MAASCAPSLSGNGFFSLVSVCFKLVWSNAVMPSKMDFWVFSVATSILERERNGQREREWRGGRESQLILLAKNNFYNTDLVCMLLTLSSGQDDLLLSGGILQFLRVETLQLALQILGHLGQILECWCWCCWGCHLQERETKTDKIKFKRKQ